MNINFFQIFFISNLLISLANCASKTADKISEHYCDKELVELLIFDARITNSSYDLTYNFESDAAKALIIAYNATIRFVATMSGLTRWQFVFGEVQEVEGDK